MSALRKRAFSMNRVVFSILAVLGQAGIFLLTAYILRQYASWFYYMLEIIGVFVAFYLVNDAPSYKYYWIVIILLLPVLGYILYAMWGRSRRNSKEYKRIRKVFEKGKQLQVQDEAVIDAFRSKHPNKSLVSQRLINEGFALYDHTEVQYYDIGEKLFKDLLEDLAKAEKFILLEYFIISNGELWNQIKTILASKVQEGVEVRILYDDLGSILTNTQEFRNELAEMGIRFCVFSPINKGVSNLTFNYRNHQKIAVIDGNIGYTGGLNLADEYANIKTRFGHWKDTGIRLRGEGVWGLTVTFLEMWEVSKPYDVLDYNIYKPTIYVEEAEGFVQTLSDGPANNPNNPIWDTYMHLISKSRDYIYFTTPYLVLDREMIKELTRAAKSGVDVRIITPRKYDKWYVYMITVKNYGVLLKNGIRIYEYVPGFVHAKDVVLDDETAVCGSINLDYRSFYLHYEDGVLLNDMNAVMDIKQDILNTMDKCEEISLDMWKKRPVWQKVVQSVLEIASPLM